MLDINLSKIQLRSPLILASGILGTSAEIMERVYGNSAGAVTFKSVGPARDGHENPSVLVWEQGMINAVGLSNPGYKNIKDDVVLLRERKIPAIVSIFGNTISEFIEIADYVAKNYKPIAIEANISCPNKSDGMLFGKSEKLSYELTKKLKSKVGKIPLIVKLTPNVNDIKVIAKAVEKGGADIINMGNTAGPGMVIDIDAKQPVLSFKTGGLSGPAIRPIMVRCVYDIYSVVKIPIIGTGGVSSGKDAIEMMMAGATAVGIGSAVYYEGVKVFDKINKEIVSWLKKNKYKSVKEIIGVAHGNSKCCKNKKCC